MNRSNNDQTQNNYAAFIAIDWADQKHVFSLQGAGQTTKEVGTLEQKPEVIGPWVAKLRERFGGRPVALGVEQSRGATRRQKLEAETDLFGFAVSGHPLELFSEVAWDSYCPVNRLGEFV